MEKELFAALVAAGTSVATTIILKPFIDKSFLKYQLKQNYIAEQSKKIKEHISSHKGQLLKAAELLHIRLKNFAKNHTEGWLNRNGNYTTYNHYTDTTVYRFLSFFAEIKLLEKNLIYLDATVSQKEDLRMIKYFRLFHEVMCDVDLFHGYAYDKKFPTDHFFTTPFYDINNIIVSQDSVMDLDAYLTQKNQILGRVDIIYKFFDGLSPLENRLRCERLKAFQLILISFLNEFGYDYQHTSNKKLIRLKLLLGEYKLIPNLRILIKKFKLNRFNGPIEKVLRNIS